MANSTTAEEIEYIKANLNQLFLLMMGFIVLFMQCGFAFLEAGAVRSKNTTNILCKNALDQFISGICYWLFGFAFAFGEGNAFIGHWNFASSYLEKSRFAYFFFQFVFAATAATIVSGALAERCHFVCYLVYSFFLTSFIYPVVTHWAWDSSGWLLVGFKFDNKDVTFQDFAGSGVVHMVGGTAAFVGALLMGPRMGRFGPHGKVNDIKGHSVPLAALGGFILFFGFLAFNGGSQGAIVSSAKDSEIVALAVVNTVISGSFSAILTLILNRFGPWADHKWSLLLSINGGLTGMVSACAGANVLHPWMSVIVGLGAAFFYKLTSFLVLKIRVDDPLDAVAVHFGGGFWGLLIVAFLDSGRGLVYQTNTKDLDQAGMYLLWQITGAVAITVWTGALCSLMFGILKLLKRIRCSADAEIHGLDQHTHGEPAYPESFWEALLSFFGVGGRLSPDTDNNIASNGKVHPVTEDGLRERQKTLSGTKESMPSFSVPPEIVGILQHLKTMTEGQVQVTAERRQSLTAERRHSLITERKSTAIQDPNKTTTTHM